MRLRVRTACAKQTVPQVEQEVRVGAAQASDEVILEGADGAFGRIGAVKTRRDELDVDMLVAEELLESSGALVVEALELGAEPSANEPIVDGLVRGKDGGTGLAGHGLSVDGVAVRMKSWVLPVLAGRMKRPVWSVKIWPVGSVGMHTA
jgi:hypothetical protein